MRYNGEKRGKGTHYRSPGKMLDDDMYIYIYIYVYRVCTIPATYVISVLCMYGAKKES